MDPPPLPDRETLEADLPAWEDYCEKLDLLIGFIKYHRKKQELDEELARYAAETLEERLKRRLSSDEWKFEPIEKPRGQACRSDICCVFEETDGCWFEGNLDRLNEYKGAYRLLGTAEVYLCSPCLRNYIDSDEVAKAIEDNFDGEIEVAKAIEDNFDGDIELGED